MRKIISFIRRYVLVSLALLLVAAYPLPALADDPVATTPPADPATTTPTDTTTTTPTDTTATPTTDTATTVVPATTTTAPTTTIGPNSPQGPSANTYIYNPDTGLWQNQYYTWNPSTGQTAPLTPQTYSYNPATGHWDTTDWIYDAAKGAYVPNVVSVVQPPAGALTIGGLDASTLGPNSSIDTTGSSTGLFDNFYNASISNSIVGQALSGNANVSINTTGGSATSGKAMDLANIINLMQSTTNLQGNLATFSMDIAGDVQGDITIDPSQLSSALGVNSNGQLPSDLTINNQGNGVINNDITLGATSGNATVDSNTTAGNATTGSADTLANIMNVINSVIASGQSFVGNINIYGNLDGDILMPQDTLNSLLASNTSNGSTTSTAGPNSPINDTANNTLTATLTDNNSINNTLNLNAQTGAANVTNNTTAGNATTGNAGTNLTVLNLTGSNVIGKDALLVFVNVLGSWVGMIVNAPTGSTSAALCNCSNNTSTAGPNSPLNTDGSTNTNVNSTNNNSINNNVRLASLSGDATVSNNTTAGNATSGNATASVNLLNISTSSLSLANWFGILFINVFGNWNGSFGVDTAAGNPASTGGTSGTQTSAGPTVKAVKVFSFSPTNQSGKNFNLVQLASATAPTDPQNTNHGVVLATTTHKTPPTTHSTKDSSMLWTAGSLFILAGILSAEEAYSKRKDTRMKFRKYIHGIIVPPLKRF